MNIAQRKLILLRRDNDITIHRDTVIQRYKDTKKTTLCIILLVSQYLSIFVSPVLASDSLYFIHTDHLGSTVAITDEDGEVVSQRRYYPYGSDKYPVSSIQYPDSAEEDNITERKYTSQVKDSETNLYYYNARYYDPALGTFVSADPAGGSLNRYSYVHGNPLRGIDPTGRQADITNPGPTVSTSPGISAGGTYVETVASTTIDNAYVSDYEPTAMDRAVLYGVAGAGAVISGGMLVAVVPEAALAGYVYATTYAPGAVAAAGTAAKVLGGAAALHQAASCLSGDQGACGNLVVGYQIYMSNALTGAALRAGRAARVGNGEVINVGRAEVLKNMSPLSGGPKSTQDRIDRMTAFIMGGRGGRGYAYYMYGEGGGCAPGRSFSGAIVNGDVYVTGQAGHEEVFKAALGNSWNSAAGNYPQFTITILNDNTRIVTLREGTAFLGMETHFTSGDIGVLDGLFSPDFFTIVESYGHAGGWKFYIPSLSAE